MSNNSIENKIKSLVEERKYEEARELLQSEYSLSDEQAVEFIQRLEQTSTAKSEKIKPGCAKKASKGCGCLSLFFAVYFVWGVYSMFSGSYNMVETEGTIVGYVDDDYVDSDAVLQTSFLPILSYTFDGVLYTDTATVYLSPEDFPVNSTRTIYVNPNYPEDFSFDSAWDMASMYIPILVFALISFVAYRYLRRFKFNIKSSEIGQRIQQMQAAAEQASEGQESTIDEAVDRPNDPSYVQPGTGESTKESHSKNPSISSNKKEIKEMPLKWLIGLALLFFAVTALLIYLKIDQNQRGSRIESGETISGLVTHERQNRGSGSSSNRTTSYTYTIQYEYQGSTREYITSHTFDNYNTGDRIQMKINPDNPEEVAINTPGDLYPRSYTLWILLTLGLGVLFSYSSIYVFKRNRRRGTVN